MGVRVRPDAADRLAASGDRFAVQVLAPDDLPAALAAMRLFRVDVVGLSGRGRRPAGEGARDAQAVARADVSQVVAAPAGPLVLVQHLDADPADLARIPEVLAHRLEDAGVGEATVAVPGLGGDLDTLDTTPGCVILRLFPNPSDSGAIPPDWLDVAVDWVVGDLHADDPVMARILSVEQEVRASEAATLLHECGVARAWCDLVNGDPADRVRTASLTYGRLPHLALAAGGPALDAGGLLARFALLQDVARELAADVAYACLDVEATFEGLSHGLPVDGWRARGGASPNRVAAVAADVVVPDAFPWQVLGPGHLARLDSLGEEPPPFEPLGDGRIEVALGEPSDWLPRSVARADAQEDAIAWLGPLLVDEDELAELEARLARRPPRPATTTSAASPSPAAPASPFVPVAKRVDLDEAVALPDLDAVVLRPSPTPRRSTRLSPLELAAWIAHEPHSDAPASVSPVLAAFVRWWAAGLDDEHLQRLKPFVPRLVGTAGDPKLDAARRWLAVDWLVRVQAPAWLRLAGLNEAADRLAGVGELTEEPELAAAVDVLGQATTLAGRRFELTASLVADDEPASRRQLDDPLAWEVWEAVTEPTAWVAASEAATFGAPGDVAYATDLRVIECSRDPRMRAELEATGAPIGSTAWTTALHAIADEAWERAWRAADRAARDASGLTIRVEMGRVAKTALARRDEVPEVALEQAETAARDTLVRAALRGGEPDKDGEHPWDAARNAARSSPGGATWSIVVDESRRAVGEAAWAQAMADARTVVEEILADAPDVAARVVAAAVAREATSAAARGVAYRAAAVARAHGADDDAAEQAARDALADTAAALRDAAFGLLDRLIDGR